MLCCVLYVYRVVWGWLYACMSLYCVCLCVSWFRDWGLGVGFKVLVLCCVCRDVFALCFVCIVCLCLLCVWLCRVVFELCF